MSISTLWSVATAPGHDDALIIGERGSEDHPAQRNEPPGYQCDDDNDGRGDVVRVAHVSVLITPIQQAYEVILQLSGRADPSVIVIIGTPIASGNDYLTGTPRPGSTGVVL
jgi:hypothetical protein